MSWIFRPFVQNEMYAFKSAMWKAWWFVQCALQNLWGDGDLRETVRGGIVSESGVSGGKTLGQNPLPAGKFVLNVSLSIDSKCTRLKTHAMWVFTTHVCYRTYSMAACWKSMWVMEGEHASVKFLLVGLLDASGGTKSYSCFISM